MSDFVWANPDRLKYNGAGYGELAHELGIVIDTTEGLLEGLEGQDIWGDDEAGQKFGGSYRPQRLVFDEGIKLVKDGLQFTADGVTLMAETFENGENNNYQRANALNARILNGGGDGEGEGENQQQYGERKQFFRSEHNQEEKPKTRLARTTSHAKVKVVKAVALVDQNGEPWPPDAQDRPKRLLSMAEMTALGMDPAGAFVPVETTLTDEEIQELVRHDFKPLTPNSDEPPVAFIGPAVEEPPKLLRGRVERGELLEPLEVGTPAGMLVPEGQVEPPLLLARLDNAEPGIPAEEPVLFSRVRHRDEDAFVEDGEPLLGRTRHVLNGVPAEFEPARFHPVEPYEPGIPPLPPQ